MGPREALARDSSEVQPNHRTAHAFLGVADFKAARYAWPTSISRLASGNPSAS